MKKYITYILTIIALSLPLSLSAIPTQLDFAPRWSIKEIKSFPPDASATKAHLSDYILEITDISLDQNLVNKVERSAKGNGTIVGRNSLVYTKKLRRGPLVASYHVTKPYGIEVSNLSPGKYRIRAGKTGFDISESIFDIPESSDHNTVAINAKIFDSNSPIQNISPELKQNKNTYSITLKARPRYSSVRYAVLDQEGAAIPNARVVLKNSFCTYKGRTDENGIWQNNKIIQGRYKLAILGPRGYGKHLEQLVRLNRNTDNHQNTKEALASIDKQIRITKIDTGSTILAFKKQNGLRIALKPDMVEYAVMRDDDHDSSVLANANPAFDDNPLNRGYEILASIDSIEYDKKNLLDNFLKNEIINPGIEPVFASQKSLFKYTGKDLSRLKRLTKNREKDLYLSAGSAGLPDSSGSQTGSSQYQGNRRENPIEEETIFKDRLEDTFAKNPKEEFTGTTDAQGLLEVSGLKQGTYKVQVMKDNVLIGTYRFQIKAGLVLKKEIIIEASTIPVQFKTVDTGDTPIANTLCLVEDMPSVEPQVSSETGKVIFSYINAGDHTLVCSKADYQELRQDFNVSNSEASSLGTAKVKVLENVTLQKEAGEAVLFAFGAAISISSDPTPIIEPIENASITITPDVPDAKIEKDPNLPGVYYITGLPIGRSYQIDVTPPDDSSGSNVVWSIAQASVTPRRESPSNYMDFMNKLNEYAASLGIPIPISVIMEMAVSRLSPKTAEFLSLLKNYKFSEGNGIALSQKAANIPGEVIDVLGKKVPGASIKLRSVNGTWDVESDTEGKFIFERVPMLQGTDGNVWIVSATKSGYIPGAGTVVSAGGELTVNWLTPMVGGRPSLSDLKNLFGYEVEIDHIKVDEVEKKLDIKAEFQIGLKEGTLPPMLDFEGLTIPFERKIPLPDSLFAAQEKVKALKVLLSMIRTRANAAVDDALEELGMTKEEVRQILGIAVEDRNDMGKLFEKILPIIIGNRELCLIDNPKTLFNVGPYEFSMEKLCLKTDGTKEGTRFGLDKALLKLTDSGGSSNLPEKFEVTGMAVSKDGFDFSSVAVNAKMSDFKVEIPALGAITTNDQSVIAFDMTNLSFSLTSALYQAPSAIGGETYGVSLGFGIFPKFSVTQFGISGIDQGIELNLGVPVVVTKFEYSATTKQISTAGFMELKEFKSCGGASLRFDVKALTLNLGSGNPIEDLQFKSSPVGITMFGAAVNFSRFDLKLQGSSWEISSAASLSFGGGQCGGEGGGDSSGDFAIPDFTIGYAKKQFYVDIRGIPINQQFNFSVAVINVDTIDIGKPDDKYRIKINGSLAMNLVIAQVEVGQITIWEDGKVNAEKFGISIPSLFGMRGWIMIGEDKIGGGLGARLPIGELSFDFMYARTTWMIAITAPITVPVGPVTLSNLMGHIEKKESSYLFGFGADVSVAGLNAVIAFSDTQLWLDTAGIISLTSTIRALSTIDAVTAEGEISFVRGDSYVMLAVSVPPPKALMAVMDLNQFGASFLAHFNRKTVMLGAFSSGQLKLIKASLNAAIVVGYNYELPPDYAYEGEYNSPEKVYGLYVMANVPRIDINMGEWFNYYFEGGVMGYVSGKPLGILAAVHEDYGLDIGFRFMGMGMGAHFDSNIKGGVQIIVGRPVVIGVSGGMNASLWAEIGCFSIAGKETCVFKGSVGVVVEFGIRVSTNNGMEITKAKLVASGVSFGYEAPPYEEMVAGALSVADDLMGDLPDTDLIPTVPDFEVKGTLVFQDGWLKKILGNGYYENDLKLKVFINDTEIGLGEMAPVSGNDKKVDWSLRVLGSTIPITMVTSVVQAIASNRLNNLVKVKMLYKDEVVYER